MSKKIFYNETNYDDHEINAVQDVLKKYKYSLVGGEKTKKFEKKISLMFGKKYGLFVNSGSSANLLMAQTLIEGKFLKNKIAVLPSVSWSTTVSPFLQLGYKVILCDCDKENLGLNTDHLEKICKQYKPGLVTNHFLSL